MLLLYTHIETTIFAKIIEFMAYTFLLPLLLCLSLPAHPETKNSVAAKSVDSLKAFTYVEKMPEFLGGDAEMMKFIRENLVYPDQAKDEGISGKVLVSFVVGTDGAIIPETIKIQRSLGGGIDQEVNRVILKMPKWTPGYHKGNPVRVIYKLPIVFAM